MKTTVNTNNKLKKCNVNGQKCKKIFVNNVQVWGAAPDYLYKDGSVDGEYLKTMTGSNNWNKDGYGFRSSDFSISKNNNIYLGAGASAGYGSTYSCENKAVSNFMDLSGATHLRFVGEMKCQASYAYSQWTYIELIDNTGKTAQLYYQKQTAPVHTGQEITTNIYDNNAIGSLGLNLEQVKIQFRYGFEHNAPWENWYGGGGELNISQIQVTS